MKVFTPLPFPLQTRPSQYLTYLLFTLSLWTNHHIDEYWLVGVLGKTETKRILQLGWRGHVEADAPKRCHHLVVASVRHEGCRHEAVGLIR